MTFYYSNEGAHCLNYLIFYYLCYVFINSLDLRSSGRRYFFLKPQLQSCRIYFGGFSWTDLAKRQVIIYSHKRCIKILLSVRNLVISTAVCVDIPTLVYRNTASVFCFIRFFSIIILFIIKHKRVYKFRFMFILRLNSSNI